MRTFAISALMGTTLAAPATIFSDGQPPKCFVLANGETRVEYSNDKHPSFKCAHSGLSCSCTLKHPTHHTGLCRQFDHSNGKTFGIGGDCTASGLNHIDGGYSAFSAWAACSKSCGTGTQSASRFCTAPAPFNGGADCVGSATRSRNCNAQACPVDGGFSAFGAWTACTKSCGIGTQSASRTCEGRAFGGQF
jgi:hypothetical protein